MAIFDEKIEIRERCNRSTRAIGTLYHMSFLTQLNVVERIPIHRSSNEH